MVRALGLRDQSILRDHALAIADLPDIHRDPFDRVLIAQAIALDAVLVTADATLARYPVESLLVA
ncbi:MAG: PIN domain-containing protein [Candidatus Dormibacteraceae bacterium]